MTTYEKAVAALRDLRRGATGDELAELHLATGHLIKAQAWSDSPVISAQSGTGLPPTPPGDGG